MELINNKVNMAKKLVKKVIKKVLKKVVKTKVPVVTPTEYAYGDFTCNACNSTGLNPITNALCGVCNGTPEK